MFAAPWPRSTNTVVYAARTPSAVAWKYAFGSPAIAACAALNDPSETVTSGIPAPS